MKKREQDLLVAAWNIVEDFERFGEVLQHGDNFDYGPDSSITRLTAAIKEYNNDEYACDTEN